MSRPSSPRAAAWLAATGSVLSPCPGPGSPSTHIFLVEDQTASDLEPLILTHPDFDPPLGATAIGSKLASSFEAKAGRRGVTVLSQREVVLSQRNTRLSVNAVGWLGGGW